MDTKPPVSSTSNTPCESPASKGKEHCNLLDLCMAIVANENGVLAVKCYDRKVNIENKIEWEMNLKVVSNQSCTIQNWSDLDLGGRNTIVCRVKKHPGTPRWQEIRGWVYREGDFEFKLN